MGGKKLSSKYKKKRKGKPFSGCQRHENSSPESTVESEVHDDVNTQGSASQEELMNQNPPCSASRRKLNLSDTVPELSLEDSVADVEGIDQGYRLAHMNTLASSISEVRVCSGEKSCMLL